MLLPPSEKARVAALWELVDDGAGFDELLDALISSGLRELPGFVLVSSGDEPTRVVLRGAARASFTLADGETVELDGGEAATWVEQILHGVTALERPPRGRGRRGRLRPRDRPGAGLARRRAAVRRARRGAGRRVLRRSLSPSPSRSPSRRRPTASGDVAFAAAPVVVPLGEISDAESERESPAPVEEPVADEVDEVDG